VSFVVFPAVIAEKIRRIPSLSPLEITEGSWSNPPNWLYNTIIFFHFFPTSSFIIQYVLYSFYQGNSTSIDPSELTNNSESKVFLVMSNQSLSKVSVKYRLASFWNSYKG